MYFVGFDCVKGCLVQSCSRCSTTGPQQVIVAFLNGTRCIVLPGSSSLPGLVLCSCQTVGYIIGSDTGNCTISYYLVYSHDHRFTLVCSVALALPSLTSLHVNFFFFNVLRTVDIAKSSVLTLDCIIELTNICCFSCVNWIEDFSLLL